MLRFPAGEGQGEEGLLPRTTRRVQGMYKGYPTEQHARNNGATHYQHACNTGASLKVQGERLGRATCLQERRYCPRRGIRGHLSPLPAGIPLIVARLRRPLVGLRLGAFALSSSHKLNE